MKEIDEFTLTKEQVDFLRKKYKDVPIVAQALAGEKDCKFTLSAEVSCDFWEWTVEQSTATMTGAGGDEPTDDTYMLESISDSMSAQDK